MDFNFDFGNLTRTEIKELAELLTAYADGNFTETAENYFYTQGVEPYYGSDGVIYLRNEEWQLLGLNNGELDMIIGTPYSGYEGYLQDLIFDLDSSWDIEDVCYIVGYANNQQKFEIFNKIIFFDNFDWEGLVNYEAEIKEWLEEEKFVNFEAACDLLLSDAKTGHIVVQSQILAMLPDVK